jgi:ribonuclease Z
MEDVVNPDPAGIKAAATTSPRPKRPRGESMWKTWTFRIGAAAVTVVTVAGIIAYLNRDWLIDRAIRERLSEAAEYSFVNDREHIRVLLCGTGSPEPSVATSQACTLVSVGGKMFLFDVGEGATKSLGNSDVPIKDIERVFITHFHSDHFNGLATFINQSWIWGRSQPLDVMGPTGTVEVVGALNSAYTIDNGFRVDNMSDLAATRAAGQACPTDIKFPQGARSVRVYEQDGITIDAHLVEHHPVEPALGYVIGYQGKKVFISGDTEVSPLNMPAMQNADLVVHEAYASHLVRRSILVMRELGMTHDAQVAERTISYHADTIELAKQAQEAHVKHLVLTHLTPYPNGFVQRYLFTQGMTDHYHGDLTVGQDGMVITL